MSKLKTIVAFCGVVAVIVLWRTYSPGSWVTVWSTIANIFSAIARF